MSTINYTYNVIVDRFRQFAAGHFQLRRFTHGEISQADLEKEAEWPWLHVKPRAINYSPGTRSFSFEIFISDLPRDKEDKTGYQAESITDCSLIFQDLINEIYLGNMFGSDVVLTRPVNAEPFVEQYTHTLTGVTGTIELNLDYDWSACSIPASWNYNTPTDSGTDGWGALQFIESLDQNGVFVSLLNDVEAPGNSYYYGTNASGVKGWYAIVDNVGLTCETLPDCATIISIVDDIAALESGKVDKVAGKGLSTEDYTTAEKSKLAGIQAGAEVNVNADWNAVSGDAQILNKPTIPAQYNPTAGTGVSITGTYPNQTITNTAPDQTVALTAGTNIGVTGTYPNFTISNTQSLAGLVPETRTLTINGTTQDLSANRTFTIATNPGTVTSVAALTLGTTGTDLSSTVATGTTTPVITLNVPTASATNRGVLSSTDWSTFNGKFTLPSLTSGSVLFSNGTTIAQSNSQLFWDNVNNRLGIGTASPNSRINALDGTVSELRFNSGTAALTPSLAVGNTGASGKFAALVAGTTGSAFIYDSVGVFDIGTEPKSSYTANTLGGGGFSSRMRLFANGNVAIGTTTDAGFKLDVNGTARVSGNITAGATVTATGAFSTSAFSLHPSSGYATFSGNVTLPISGAAFTSTSGDRIGLSFTGAFSPTSGTATYSAYSIVPTINQTGGASGITRGLYINPTLTSAADFRAIEVANGTTVLAPSVTARASLRIPSGTAPTSPVNGDIWFDGTNIKMQIGGVTKTFTLI